VIFTHLHFGFCPGALTCGTSYFHFIHDTFDFAQLAQLISVEALGLGFAGFLAFVGSAQLFEGIALRSLAFALYTSGQSL
jgi:hypothetical protein